MDFDKDFIKKHYDIFKIAHAIIFFNQEKVENIGITKLMKLFFFSDKLHLEKFCKTIFNDNYIKLQHGPVPSWTHNLLKSSNNSYDYDFNDEVSVFSKLVTTNLIPSSFDESKYKYEFKPKVAFESNFFSKSQLEVLKEIALKYRKTTAKEISDISHNTNAWKYANMHDLISKVSMIDDEEMKKYVTFLEKEKNNFSNNYGNYKLNK